MRIILLGILVLTLFCISASVVVADPPANDDCANATDAGTLESESTIQLSGTLSEATKDCAYSSGPEVWVSFTLTGCMDVAIDFCDDENDVNESSEYLFGECPCGGMIYNSWQEYCQDSYNLSKTWYGLEAGTYYYPIWPEASADSYTVNITGTDCPPAPANDDCSSAISVGEVTDLSYTTRGASFDGEGECMYSPNIWYIYTPTFTGNIRATVDADYDSKIAVYNGGSCSPISDEIGCSSDDFLDFAVVFGNQYLIEIGGVESDNGDGLLNIGQAPESPSNDDCADADNAGTLSDDVSVQLTGTVVNATVDCGNLGYPEVWIKFAVPDYMHVTIDFCGQSPELDIYDVALILYTECPCSGAIAFNEYSMCDDYNPSMEWQYLPAGTYYYPILSSYALTDSYVVNIIGDISSEPPTGACCKYDSLTCEVTTQFNCANILGGTYRGDGTDCGTYEEGIGWSGCIDEEPTGACCFNDGTSCVDDVTIDDCYDSFSGEWRGGGSVCGEPDPETGVYEGCGGSEPATGACCYDGGESCVDDVSDTDCYELYEGEYQGDGSSCGEPDPETGIYEGCQDDPTGACCVGDDCMGDLTQDDCEDGWGGTFMGEGTDCTDSDENGTADVCEEPATYDYLPGDANMVGGGWKPSARSNDVTYLVNYFRGSGEACFLDEFYAAADANGNCRVQSSDVTYLVNYFRGGPELRYCSDYEPAWLSSDDAPEEKPDGWPYCD